MALPNGETDLVKKHKVGSVRRFALAVPGGQRVRVWRGSLQWLCALRSHRLPLSSVTLINFASIRGTGRVSRVHSVGAGLDAQINPLRPVLKGPLRFPLQSRPFVSGNNRLQTIPQ